MTEEYQHALVPVSIEQLQLATMAFTNARVKPYGKRRRDWVNANSYFRHFWRAFGAIGAAIIGGVIASLAFRRPLPEVSIGVGCACGAYLVVWGVEYAVKWGWFAPPALEIEAKNQSEVLLGIVASAQASIDWHKKQSEHFQRAYLEAYQRII